ncbi:MAG: metallophosphoesterase [Deltaproteobacteria bacterium]|nr:metallophosphoesterase [Deltaproteobacteria bacterium]
MKVTSNRSTEQIEGPIAILADIAGNLAALDAVLAACRHAGAGFIVAAGGICHQGPEPLAVWERLLSVNARLLRGPSDLALATVEPSSLRPRSAEDRRRADSHKRVREALGELILARLKRFPDLLRVELASGSELAVMVGSPADPFTPFTHDMSDDELLSLLRDDSADVLVCGGSGLPFLRPLDGLTLVGAGSVGDSPDEHSPDGLRSAHFTLVLPTDDGLRVEPRWVQYRPASE